MPASVIIAVACPARRPSKTKEISASKTAKDALMKGVGDVLVSMVSNKICLDYL